MRLLKGKRRGPLIFGLIFGLIGLALEGGSWFPLSPTYSGGNLFNDLWFVCFSIITSVIAATDREVGKSMRILIALGVGGAAIIGTTAGLIEKKLAGEMGFLTYTALLVLIGISALSWWL